MILEKILDHKRLEVERSRAERPLDELKEQLCDVVAPRGFAASLNRRSAVGTAIIAEVKKGSPSKGIIRADFNPVEIAATYEKSGATCLSVLTDREFFMGDLSYLSRVAQVVSLPLLRKDFIVDEYQVYEARVNRADAILLIAAALPPERLTSLAELACDLGMDVLLEVHDEEELQRCKNVPASLIGINNRNLQTFETDLAVTERLLPLVAPGTLVVAESGIHTRQDIERLLHAGAGAFLIGESLMREKDIEAKLRSLL